MKGLNSQPSLYQRKFSFLSFYNSKERTPIEINSMNLGNVV